MKDKQLTHRWSLTKTGATTDKFTPKGSMIMIATVFLYGIIQVADPPASITRAISCTNSDDVMLEDQAYHEAFS